MASIFDSDDIEVSPTQTAKALGDGSIQLIDVREQHEWDEGRIEGAVHIPLADLTGSVSRIDKGRPVVFQCKSGGRSLMAAQAFQASGYEAYSMAGGLEQWDNLRLPMIPEGATVA
jgi:rhodanese-related sulfurtransferase